jgi:hypothetical protein
MKNKKETKPLSWNELADIFDKETGRCARILPMNRVFNWAEKQTNKFFVDKEGYIYLLSKDK